MRSHACATLFLALALGGFAQSPDPQRNKEAGNNQYFYCPNTHQLELSPSQKFFLEGTIGKGHVRMYLDRGGSGVVGLFFDKSSWQITEIGGRWMDGQIEASDAGENHPETGHLRAVLNHDRLIGTWTAVDSNSGERIDLANIHEPTCDGKEPWKQRADADSPVSFAYPASWHLEQDRDGIRLTCPDPSEIAYSRGVFLQMGTGSFSGPPELVRCSDKWIYGTTGSECDCDHPDKMGCNNAKATRKGQATILDVGEHEWRTYCHSGGYVGQGEGEDRIILLPHSWIEIMADGKAAELIDRLVDSVEEQPATNLK